VTFARHYEVELDALVRVAFVVCGDLATAEDAVADATQTPRAASFRVRQSGNNESTGSPARSFPIRPMSK
jgi:hypothetical protein